MSEEKENKTQKNSFKELERMQLEQYKKNTEKIGGRVKGSLGTIGLISDIIELYFSRIVDVFINLSSSSAEQNVAEEVEEEE